MTVVEFFTNERNHFVYVNSYTQFDLGILDSINLQLQSQNVLKTLVGNCHLQLQAYSYIQCFYYITKNIQNITKINILISSLLFPMFLSTVINILS